MRTWFCGVLFLPVFCWGLEASLLKEKNGTATLSFQGIEVPHDQVRKLLRSGLHNRFEFELTATEGDRVLLRDMMSWKVYYDLWEDVYRLTAQNGPGQETSRIYKSIEDFLSDLKNPAFEKMDLRNLGAGHSQRNLTVELRVALNPVSQETIERMKKLVNQRRVPGSPGLPSDKDPRPNKESDTRAGGLFNEILEREMDRARKNAAWMFSGKSNLKIKEPKQ